MSERLIKFVAEYEGKRYLEGNSMAEAWCNASRETMMSVEFLQEVCSMVVADGYYTYGGVFVIESESVIHTPR